MTQGTTRTVPALKVHKVQAFLQFDQHGLQPYWGVVNALEPGEDTEREPFQALGLDWHIDSTSYWQGKLEHPDGRFDDGLYEYRYQLRADDEVGDRDATIALRPGFPDATHVDTGDPIQSMPDETPECLRVEIMTTNIDPEDVLELLRAWFEDMGLNPDYISTPNDWSTITSFEGYVRVDRDETKYHITGEGGLLQQLAQFGSSKGDRGEHKWDHQQTVGHFETVSLDRDSWSMLMPEQHHAKVLKSYHPKHVRAERDDPDDPLYHPKLEVRLWEDERDTVPWHEKDALYEEFLTTAANALHWSGVGLDADSEVFIADGYHAGGWSAEEVPIYANPIPDVAEQLATDARDHLTNPEVTPAEFDVIRCVADGGADHYRNLADLAGVSVSTVYRAVDKLPILQADGGRIDFPDQVTQERVAALIERFKKVTDGVRQNLRDAIQGFGRLTNGDSDPSALERWMDAHGAILTNHVDDLHFRFDGEFTEHEIVEMLRSGYSKAVQSGLERQFREALITYQTADGDRRKRWQVITQRGGRDQILGRWPLRA